MSKVIRANFKKRRFAFERLHPDEYAELDRLMKIIELIGFDRLTYWEYKAYRALINHVDTWKDKKKSKNEKQKGAKK